MKTLILSPIFIFMISFALVESVFVEPAQERNIASILMKQEVYVLGQIVKLRTGQLFIIELDRSQRCFGFELDLRLRNIRVLSGEELVLYNRIRSRHPTTPEHYKIPQIYYTEHDEMHRPEEGTNRQVGLAANPWTMYYLGVNREIQPKDGDMLMRLTEFPTAPPARRFQHVHIATYSNDMWVATSLLPRHGDTC